MTRHVVTIPGDEAVWEAHTDDDHVRVGEAHVVVEVRAMSTSTTGVPA